MKVETFLIFICIIFCSLYSCNSQPKKSLNDIKTEGVLVAGSITYYRLKEDIKIVNNDNTIYTTISRKENQEIVLRPVCKGRTEDNNNRIKDIEIVQTELIIDSLELDLNKDGMTDRIELIETDEETNRILKIKIKNGEDYNVIATNDKMITCSTCGYQGGDPYISLTSGGGGFIVNLDRITLYFDYESNSIYLKKMDILMVKQTPESIEEKHEVYLEKDFGKVELSRVGSDLRALLN
ncbi:hypothetical protein [Sinomicrobium oceani]|uniref:hypothetical protein n=1 Tax=Sinomicrobium oceani TaxID=1150368 RepID=UPI00227C79CF|nr:hypothetical protein [Sinomicrobium oceani]